jgi:hypothetical protein
VGYSYVAFHLGYALAISGEPLDGLDILQKTVELAEARGFVARHALRLAYLAEAMLVARRTMEAERVAARSVEFALAHDERANHAYGLRVSAEVRLRQERFAESLHLFEASRDLARELGMRPLEANCLSGCAAVLRGLGRAEEAAIRLGESRRLADEMKLTLWTHIL